VQVDRIVLWKISDRRRNNLSVGDDDIEVRLEVLNLVQYIRIFSDLFRLRKRGVFFESPFFYRGERRITSSSGGPVRLRDDQLYFMTILNDSIERGKCR